MYPVKFLSFNGIGLFLQLFLDGLNLLQYRRSISTCLTGLGYSFGQIILSEVVLESVAQSTYKTVKFLFRNPVYRFVKTEDMTHSVVALVAYQHHLLGVRSSTAVTGGVINILWQGLEVGDPHLADRTIKTVLDPVQDTLMAEAVLTVEGCRLLSVDHF